MWDFSGSGSGLDPSVTHLYRHSLEAGLSLARQLTEENHLVAGDRMCFWSYICLRHDMVVFGCSLLSSLHIKSPSRIWLFSMEVYVIDKQYL